MSLLKITVEKLPPSQRSSLETCRFRKATNFSQEINKVLRKIIFWGWESLQQYLVTQNREHWWGVGVRGAREATKVHLGCDRKEMFWSRLLVTTDDDDDGHKTTRI